MTMMTMTKTGSMMMTMRTISCPVFWAIEETREDHRPVVQEVLKQAHQRVHRGVVQAEDLPVVHHKGDLHQDLVEDHREGQVEVHQVARTEVRPALGPPEVLTQEVHKGEVWHLPRLLQERESQSVSQ